MKRKAARRLIRETLRAERLSETPTWSYLTVSFKDRTVDFDGRRTGPIEADVFKMPVLDGGARWGGRA